MVAWLVSWVFQQASNARTGGSTDVFVLELKSCLLHSVCMLYFKKILFLLQLNNLELFAFPLHNRNVIA